MALTLDEHVFEIRQATLGGVILDPYWCKKYNRNLWTGLSWHLEVRTKRRRIQGEWCQPMLFHQSLPFRTRNWMDFAGQTFSWDATRRGKKVQQDCGLHMWEVEEIPTGTLYFGNRAGHRFLITWRGTTAFAGLSLRTFSVEADIVFLGITVRGNERDTDELMRERLAEHVESADYIQRPIQVSDFKYESGLRTAESLFKPRRRR